MTRRLVLSYVGLAAILLALLEIPLGVLAARHERGTAAAQAEREATAIALFASEDMEQGRTAALAALVRSYQQRTGGEVSVIDPAGQVVATSSTDSDNDATGEDAALVQAALAGRPVDSFVSDEGRPWSRAAVPIAAGGQPGGAVLVGYPANATENRVHEIWMALVVFGVGLVAFTALLGVLLARSVTRPLRRLEATVSSFAEGDLGTRAWEGGPAEVRDLAARFNHMADRLNQLLESQSRFVADASHQLRSPLTALRLRLENLEAGSDGAAADGIAAAGQEVQRLSRIVDGLLTLGRAEGEDPDRRPVDVTRVIADRCDAWSALAEERGVELRSSGWFDAGGEEVAWLVPGDLEQMLDNLIANALDVLDPGGHLDVALRREGSGKLAVHVIDDGPGMAPEDRDRAFDRFWQAPGVKAGHSGLGLAIVAQLAGRNAVRVELRQAEPNGLDAVIELPAAPTTAGPAPEMVSATLRTGKTFAS